MATKVMCVILMFYIVPCVMGSGVNRILKLDKGIVNNYLVGHVFIWALFQLITVPLVLMKQSFLLVVGIVNAIIVVMCVWVMIDSYIHRSYILAGLSKLKTKKLKGWDWFALIVMFVMLGWLLHKIIFLQHMDSDDSRFVVNVTNILSTNRMYLTDLITGQHISTWIGEMIKDITSPWAVYIAYYAKMTGLSGVITAHSVLPVAIILCGMSVYWLLSGELLKKDGSIADRSIFMCFAILLIVYGYYSRLTSSVMMLGRTWQGKAVVASVAIPVVYLIGMWIYENEKKRSNYILMLMLNLGMCMMSGMGIVIGAVMLGGMGLVFGITKRDLWLTMKLWGLCVPNMIYFAISELQPEIWYLHMVEIVD